MKTEWTSTFKETVGTNEKFSLLITYNWLGPNCLAKYRLLHLTESILYRSEILLYKLLRGMKQMFTRLYVYSSIGYSQLMII